MGSGLTSHSAVVNRLAGMTSKIRVSRMTTARCGGWRGPGSQCTWRIIHGIRPRRISHVDPHHSRRARVSCACLSRSRSARLDRIGGGDPDRLASDRRGHAACVHDNGRRADCRCRRIRNSAHQAASGFAFHHADICQGPAAAWRHRARGAGGRHRVVGCGPVFRHARMAEIAGLPGAAIERGGASLSRWTGQ